VFVANRKAINKYGPSIARGRVLYIQAKQKGDVESDLTLLRRRAERLHVVRVTANHFNVLIHPCVANVAMLISREIATVEEYQS
jgi:hypothetical protein